MRVAIPRERRLGSGLDSSSPSDTGVAERQAMLSGAGSSRAATAQYGDSACARLFSREQQPVEDVEALLAAAMLERAYGEECEEIGIGEDACVWEGEPGRAGGGGEDMSAAPSKQTRVWRQIVILCESEFVCFVRGLMAPLHLPEMLRLVRRERPLIFSAYGVCAGARRRALHLPPLCVCA